MRRSKRKRFYMLKVKGMKNVRFCIWNDQKVIFGPVRSVTRVYAKYDKIMSVLLHDYKFSRIQVENIFIEQVYTNPNDGLTHSVLLN